MISLITAEGISYEGEEGMSCPLRDPLVIFDQVRRSAEVWVVYTSRVYGDIYTRTAYATALAHRIPLTVIDLSTGSIRDLRYICKKL